MKKILYSLFALAVSAMTFVSCSDVPEPYDNPNNGKQTTKPEVVGTPSGSGTQAEPYNVAAAMQLIKAAKADENTAPMYVKGTIVEIKDNGNNKFGNATYYIADSKDATQKLMIFQSLYLGNKKFTTGTELKEGDEVVVYGPFVNYKGNTPETAGKGATYIYSLNGQTAGNTTPAVSDNSASNPYSVDKALELISTGKATENEVYVKGVITKVEYYNTKFSSLTYYISDNGQPGKELQIFSGKSFNGAKFSGKSDLQVGQTVVVQGVIKAYTNSKTGVVTNEMDKENKLVSVNGKTELQPGTTTTPATPATNGSLKIDGTTVTLTNSAVTAGTETVTLDLNAANLSDNQKEMTVTFSDGSKVIFEGNGEQNVPVFMSKSKGVRVYKNNKMTFEGKKAIAKIVFTCDTYKGEKYVGNAEATITFEGKKAVYTNVFNGTTGGGVQLRVQTITITYAN